MCIHIFIYTYPTALQAPAPAEGSDAPAEDGRPHDRRGPVQGRIPTRVSAGHFFFDGQVLYKDPSFGLLSLWVNVLVSNNQARAVFGTPEKEGRGSLGIACHMFPPGGCRDLVLQPATPVGM